MKVHHFNTFDTEKVRVLSKLFGFSPFTLYTSLLSLTCYSFIEHLQLTFTLYHTANTKKAYKKIRNTHYSIIYWLSQ